MIKAVFFDFDGVLTVDKTGSTTTTRFISQLTGIDLPLVKAAFARHNTDLTLGRTTHSEVWGELCEELGRRIDLALLEEAFESTPMNEEMIKLAQRLRSSYVVGIITDNKKDRIEYLRRRHNLDALFHSVTVSADVGSDKGGQDIFLAALHSAGVEPADAVFIDNNHDNLFVPKSLGMRTCFHDDEVNDVCLLVRALQDVGVAIGVTCPPGSVPN